MFKTLSWLLCSELILAAEAAKSLQSCPTLCNPIDGSPLGSSVPGILQARILEWVAISFSNLILGKGRNREANEKSDCLGQSRKFK